MAHLAPRAGLQGVEAHSPIRLATQGEALPVVLIPWRHTAINHYVRPEAIHVHGLGHLAVQVLQRRLHPTQFYDALIWSVTQLLVCRFLSSRQSSSYGGMLPLLPMLGPEAVVVLGLHYFAVKILER